MLIIPAIDLLNGKVVRLTKGKKETAKVYSSDPVGFALQWRLKGAALIHVVDLNAAFGDGDNEPIIEDIIAADLKVQVGGGIRTIEKARRLIALGVDHIIVGTKATDKEFLDELLERFSDKVAIGVDVLNGKFMASGWVRETEHNFLDFVRYLAKKGVSRIIYTDISRDGTLSGANIEDATKLKNIKGVEYIVSGGVASMDDIKAIKKNLSFVYGIITGKAIYEGTLDLEEAIDYLRQD